MPRPMGVHPYGAVEVTGHRPPNFPGSCGLTCEPEVAERVWTANDPSVNVCAALRDAVKSWEAVGFEESPPNPREVPQPQTCDVEGSLLGHPAGAQAFPAVGGDPAFNTFATRW